MNRLSGIVAGLLVAGMSVGQTGCSGKAPQPASSTGTEKGVLGQYYYVNLFATPVGGVVTSTAGGIACGARGVTVGNQTPPQYSYDLYADAGACGTAGQTRIPWGQGVTLTAAGRDGNDFLGWAGDCSGEGACSLSAGADKTVVAVFGKAGSAHTNFSDPGAHRPAYLAQTLSCTACHGAALLGKGIAPSCKACHAWPIGPQPVVTYSLGGTVSRLVGSGLVLSASFDGGAAEDLSIAQSGAFTFPTSGRAGSSYAVTVKTQPDNGYQQCNVIGGTGTLNARVDTVAVTCSASLHRLGGAISGLTGAGLILGTAGAADFPVAAGATSFIFADRLEAGVAYDVTVVQHPDGQLCTVAGGTGAMPDADVTGVAVSCQAGYRLGGMASGLNGSGLVLTASYDSAPGQLLAIVANGPFTFVTPGLPGAIYEVTITSQPTAPEQVCTLSFGAGALLADVTTLSVDCVNTHYAVGGTLAGLTGSGLVLATPGLPDLPVAAGATTFAFAEPLLTGSSYAVSVVQQPYGQRCTVAAGAGTVGLADVASVAVTCVNGVSVGGTVSGLAGSGLTLASPGQPTLVLASGTTAFSFQQAQQAGSAYSVTVLQHPSAPSQHCSIANPAGVVTGSNVTSIAITCRSDWSVVAAGPAFTLGIRPDGTLWAWGSNSAGQLGLSGVPFPYQPNQVGIDTDWATLATGSAHVLAVKTDGTLWAWGANSGQLGLGDTTSRPNPTQVGTGTSWAQVSSRGSQSAGVMSDGTLWTWGVPAFGAPILAPTRVGIDADWAAVATGSDHYLALKRDGSLWGWGTGSSGQLGGGNGYSFVQPVRTGTDDRWTSIAAGGGCSFGLMSDGTLWSWGSVASGRLGTGASANQLAPVQVGTATSWRAVSVAEVHVLAVRSDGTLWGWGTNSSSQLGGTVPALQATPVQLGTDADWAAAAGGNHTVAVKADGTLWAWGANDKGQLGNGIGEFQPTQARVGTDNQWASVAVGASHSLAVKTDGTLWSWGANGSNQLGIGAGPGQYAPVRVGSDADWAAVAAGTTYSVGLKTNGTLWSWGTGAFGGAASGTPVQVGTDTSWATVSSGTDFALALKANGTLWGWGRNTSYQLGLGDAADRVTAVQIGTDSDWGFVVTAPVAAMGIKRDLTVWGWGDGRNLGLSSSPTFYTTPNRMDPWYRSQALAAPGDSMVQAIGSDGSLWAWGIGFFGESDTAHFGEGPLRVIPGTWAQVLANGASIWAVKSDGTLWGWGRNSSYQLGDPTSSYPRTIRQIGSSAGWTSLALGVSHSLAIRADGTLWAAGALGTGALGLGVGGSAPSPVPVQ